MRFVLTHASDYFFIQALLYEDRAIERDKQAAQHFACGDIGSKALMDMYARQFRSGADQCLAAAVDFEPKRFTPKEKHANILEPR